MAATSNQSRIRTLSRIFGGVTAGAVVVLSALALTSHAAPPALSDDPKSPSASSPTLESRLMPLIKAHQGKVAVAVKSLANGNSESFRYHADDVMPTASLIKFPVMIEAYRQAAAKKIDLESFITVKKEDKVPGSGVLTYHFSDGVTIQAPRRGSPDDRLLGQHRHEPGPRRDRHRGNRGDHGEDGISQHQDPLEGLPPRYLGLPRAKQEVRPG